MHLYDIISYQYNAQTFMTIMFQNVQCSEIQRHCRYWTVHAARKHSVMVPMYISLKMGTHS